MRDKQLLCFNNSRIYGVDLAPYMCTLNQGVSAADCSNVMVMLFLIHCLFLLPLFVCVCGGGGGWGQINILICCM